jgi:GGDEF domain-containing protein
MPDERQKPPRTPGPKRARRFVVSDRDDHRVTEQIEKFLSGPKHRDRTQSPPPVASARPAETPLDTRSDFEAALRRETARTKRYGRPATVLAVEFDVSTAHRVAEDAMAGDGPVLRAIDRLARPIGYALRREARDTDRIARVAPNRFHVLLPETSEADALRYIDRARHACEVWFTGAALPVQLRIESASAGRDLSLVDALAAVEERLSA